MEHMRANVTGYKVPRSVEFRDALPTTNVGKILRRELRDEELKKLGVEESQRVTNKKPADAGLFD